MSEECKCISCYQPDMPFITYYIFTADPNKVFKIYEDPTDKELSTINSRKAFEEINRFDILMAGGNPDV